MDTKLKGDIAEQAVVLKALKMGCGVLMPIGDRMPYDVVFDVNGKLIKVQVKSNWFDENRRNYFANTKRTKTNRRNMVREVYNANDFGFAVLYIQDLDVFCVIPVDVFITYGSEIHLVEAEKRQRKPKCADFRKA